jgi:hypothetical protein
MWSWITFTRYLIHIIHNKKPIDIKIIYINSLGLLVCDRAWEGAGWARTGHEHGWELGTVTGGIGHGRARHGRIVSERHGYSLVKTYVRKFWCFIYICCSFIKHDGYKNLHLLLISYLSNLQPWTTSSIWSIPTNHIMWSICHTPKKKLIKLCYF